MLWSIGAAPAHEVVTAACDALVAGLDSPALLALASRTRGEADYEVPGILPAALEELGLTYYAPGSRAGEEAAVRALANQLLSGELTPRELALRAHQRFGHRLPLAERLAELDDEYDTLEYSGRTPAQLDADITSEAHRLARRPRSSPEPMDAPA
ncbi:hypothetical protein FHX73_14132 [Kitasatospora viridis]|uniref:Uncharacterized protein n=1 Tax=Kitasatospora viridis TaxID=281105 RepID=A0A561T6B0_9ACTN|nr:hypothetical protein FHX73_14132 [Kitasatospora viridis]